MIPVPRSSVSNSDASAVDADVSFNVEPLAVVHHTDHFLHLAISGPYGAEESAGFIETLAEFVEEGRLPTLALIDYRRTTSWTVPVAVGMRHAQWFMGLDFPKNFAAAVLSPHRRSGILLNSVAKLVASHFQATHHTSVPSAMGYLQSKAEALGLPPPPPVFDDV